MAKHANILFGIRDATRNVANVGQSLRAGAGNVGAGIRHALSEQQMLRDVQHLRSQGIHVPLPEHVNTGGVLGALFGGLDHAEHTYQAGRQAHVDQRTREAMERLGMPVPAHYRAAAGGAPPGPPTEDTSEAAGGFLQRNAAPLALAAGTGLAGLSLLRSGNGSQEQDTRIQDYMRNAQSNLDTPVPSLSVYASYDEFSAEKTAALNAVKTASSTPAPINPYPTAQSALANALANQLAAKFVGDPIDAIHKVLRKKLYEEPQHHAAFNDAVNSDQMLQEHHAQNPQALSDAYKTLKTFAPSLSKDPHVTRSWLRQAVMSGMHNTGPDFATIRLLSETEKNIQHAGNE
jgi:hypothetical protein